MFIERLVLDNFQCFGPGRTTVNLDQGLTAFIGTNGSGKTAACQALLRLFGITAQERTVRADDFHVPAGETSKPRNRELTIEAVLAFPELRDEGAGSTDLPRPGGTQAVPEFFARMAAADDGDLKVRIVLQAVWVDDGTVDGAVSDTRMVVRRFSETFNEDEWVPFTNAERGRIQMIYIPASRDGARQVTAFLRGRLWRAVQWSQALRDRVEANADQLAEQFASEPAVAAVETVLTGRWQELHDAGTHAVPKFRLLDGDLSELVRGSELVFEPGHTGRARPARLLSDGQRSLLHLALTAAALDVEAAVTAGQHDDKFELAAAQLPTLTLIAVEEPENSLSPFYLSRIVAQLQQLSQTLRTQAVISSHSASVLTRIDPDDIRYFRLDPAVGLATVREITLPADGTEAGKYVREAVRAHPELYFAKFVLLGEGDTEQVVLPRIAQAQGVMLDLSFVAVVPLGGRHTNHLWRLLNDLDIPHATLLDLDYGRAGAGPARLRDACRRLADSGIDVLDSLDGYDQVEDISDESDAKLLKPILLHLRTFGIFFAAPLDLDYVMLSAFPQAYVSLDPGERGPISSDAIDAVLGDADTAAKGYWDSDERRERLRWYRYLFLSRSKPSTHLRALSRLTDDDLKKDAPAVITALVSYIRSEVGL
ncbi:ATP-dependent nuclease [Micromonospora aurantiaca]|uniref:ATP-dependent nuclease n=1 Tax=Micromonospora aurantiaca (nom. illeg.) TaxID=47850 RepID=UPI000F40067C|nr:AAA family ATPase [Micromonospora aurantiaca]RNH98870.1 ATP-dependent endonuclease [Micromonospora aurantiaca]